jgi:hypothetical protein
MAQEAQEIGRMARNLAAYAEMRTEGRLLEDVQAEWAVNQVRLREREAPKP